MHIMTGSKLMLSLLWPFPCSQCTVGIIVLLALTGYCVVCL